MPHTQVGVCRFSECESLDRLVVLALEWQRWLVRLTPDDWFENPRLVLPFEKKIHDTGVVTRMPRLVNKLLSFYLLATFKVISEQELTDL